QVELLLEIALAHVLEDGPVREPLEVGGRLSPRVRIHERHVLVGEAGHRARHADAADVRAPSDAVDPPAHGHVALDHRALAAELDQAAMVRAVLRREVALLGEAGAVASLAHGPAEQALRAALILDAGT